MQKFKFFSGKNFSNLTSQKDINRQIKQTNIFEKFAFLRNWRRCDLIGCLYLFCEFNHRCYKKCGGCDTNCVLLKDYKGVSLSMKPMELPGIREGTSGTFFLLNSIDHLSDFNFEDTHILQKKKTFALLLISSS